MTRSESSDGISSELEQQIAELLSAELDEALTVSEQRKLRGFREQHPELCLVLQQRLQSAGAALRSIPVRGSLYTIINGEDLLRAERKLQVEALPPEKRKRGGRGQLMMLVVVASLLFLVVPRFLSQRQQPLFAFLDSSPPGSAAETSADYESLDAAAMAGAATAETAGDIAVAADGVIAEASVNASESEDAQWFASAAAGSGGAAGDVQVAMGSAGSPGSASVRRFPLAAPLDEANVSEMSTESAGTQDADRASQLLWLSEANDWRVVVVSVKASDPADLLADVDRVLERHGLQRDAGTVESESDWIGVVVSGTEEEQQQLIMDVERELDSEDAEWDPARVMHSSREEIVAAVRRSLVTPTLAEVSRGDVFVAVRNSPQATPLVAQNSGQPEQRQAESQAGIAAARQSKQEAAAKQQVAAVVAQQRPLLIVISRGRTTVNG